MRLIPLIAALIVAGTLERPASTSPPALTEGRDVASALAPESAGRLRTVRRLQRGPLSHHAFKIEAAGWRHGVSPFAIVAIAGVESSYGRYPCRNNRRNIWGLGACGRAWHPPHFSTWRQAYNYYAHFLRRTWPRARTVYDLHGYCECGGWAAKVASLMRSHYGAGPGVRYP